MLAVYFWYWSIFCAFSLHSLASGQSLDPGCCTICMWCSEYVVNVVNVVDVVNVVNVIMNEECNDVVNMWHCLSMRRNPSTCPYLWYRCLLNRLIKGLQTISLKVCTLYGVTSSGTWDCLYGPIVEFWCGVEIQYVVLVCLTSLRSSTKTSRLIKISFYFLWYIRYNIWDQTAIHCTVYSLGVIS